MVESARWRDPSLAYGVCPYCDGVMHLYGPRRRSRDHIHPKSKGGILSDDNKLIVCQSCNSDKGSFSLEEWQKFLRAGSDPRSDRIARLIEVRIFEKAERDRRQAIRMAAIAKHKSNRKGPFDYTPEESKAVIDRMFANIPRAKP